MKLLQSVVLTILISTSCYSSLEVDNVDKTTSDVVQSDDYFDSDEDNYINTTSFLCMANCTCSARSQNTSIEVDCSGRDIKSLPVPDKNFESFLRLDFSCNELVTLPNNSFRYYPLVEEILLFLDEIETVEVDAFKGLNNLKGVDLSDNYIMYIHPDVFKGNLNLEKLVLSGNPLLQVSGTGPILNAPTLEFLDISNCKLSALSSASFTNLKSIRSLDLGSNYLESISVGTLAQMEDLQSVNLDNNRWSCDCNLKALLEYKFAIISNDSSEMYVHEPIRCLVSDGSTGKVWSLSNVIQNCQNEDIRSDFVTLPDASSDLDPMVLNQEISEDVEIKIIYIEDILPLPDSTEYPVEADKAMVFGSIIFYLQSNSNSVYFVIILVAIVITAVLLSIICLKIVLNSRTDRADRENQKKKNLMISFGVEFEDKTSSFVPLLNPCSSERQGLSTPPCDWRPLANNQYDNPQSLFEEYVNTRRPYNVCETNK